MILVSDFDCELMTKKFNKPVAACRTSFQRTLQVKPGGIIYKKITRNGWGFFIVQGENTDGNFVATPLQWTKDHKRKILLF